MMNNFLNKNSLIGALIILLLLTSWWGQSESGANRQLIQDKEAAEAQLATAEVKAADTRQALQEKTAALTDAEKKLSVADTTIQRLTKEFSEKKSALATLNNEEKILLKKISSLEDSLKKAQVQQAQTGSAHQKNIQKTVTEYKEALAKLKKSEAQVVQLAKKLTEQKTQAEARLKRMKAQVEARTAKLKAQVQARAAKVKAQTEAQIAKLQKNQAEAATETESLRAQVIGFEKVVEERNAVLAEIGSDLQSCKVNTKVLLSKITEQENAQQGMEEKMRLMVQDLSAEAAYENIAPAQQEQQPVQAK